MSWIWQSNGDFSFLLGFLWASIAGGKEKKKPTVAAVAVAAGSAITVSSSFIVRMSLKKESEQKKKRKVGRNESSIRLAELILAENPQEQRANLLRSFYREDRRYIIYFWVFFFFLSFYLFGRYHCGC